MNSYGWLVWLFLMIGFAALEAATVNLVSVWFAGGAVAGMVAQLFGASVPVQLLAFLLVSALLLGCLRPFVRKYASPKAHTPTNADMVLGREACLTETVNNREGTGALKLDGKVWTARSAEDAVLEAGTLVKVVKLEGVKLLVEPVA